GRAGPGAGRRAVCRFVEGAASVWEHVLGRGVVRPGGDAGKPTRAAGRARDHRRLRAGHQRRDRPRPLGGLSPPSPGEIQRMLYYFLFLGLFAARKVLDQYRSSRNVRRLQEQRQVLPTKDRAFPWMLLAHVTFFVLTPVEVVLLDRQFLPALGIPMIV